MIIDPAKPIAAFIEYTLKPIIEDSHELLTMMKEQGYSREDLQGVAGLFVFQVAMDFLKSIVVTGIICLTLYFILSHSQIAG